MFSSGLMEQNESIKPEMDYLDNDVFSFVCASCSCSCRASTNLMFALTDVVVETHIFFLSVCDYS